MSDTQKNLTEIYNDIDLCYKVMGLTFSDPPERVDKVYKSLIDEYNQKLHSGDQSVRKQAQDNIEQTNDLYERITSSMIYKDYAREYEKYKSLKADEIQEKKQETEKEVLVNCPYCRKLISPKHKVCIYCHGKILSPTEALIQKAFRTRNVVVASIIVVLILAGVLFVLNPQILTNH